MITTYSVWTGIAVCLRGMQWLEGDIVLCQETLIVAKTIQQLSLRESAASLTRNGCSRDALDP